MSERVTAVVDTVTGQFVDRFEPGPRYQIVEVPRNPDPRADRPSVDTRDPIRPATTQEIAEFDAARLGRVLAEQVAKQPVMGAFLRVMAGRLGVSETDLLNEVKAHMTR